MSQLTSLNLQPLDKKLRNKLERTVKEAREVAESGALAALKQLEVGQAKVKSLTSEHEKDLRRRLRIHGRQLGDRRKASGDQELGRLVDEIAYEHWHRMLFARFLAENHLLMYPDPDDPVSVSLDDCEEMAADESAKNGWELAARFATKMLPQIFRVDSPVFELEMPPEKQQRLESLLGELDDEVFTASDSIGWVYQFWQAKRKDEVNASEVKIGARELPAVTQLFTEPYMVSFLLDNSLGAWWAARRLTEEDLRTAKSEQELRKKASLPAITLEYLRFVRTPSGDEAEGEENTGPWIPAAGTFDSWPDSLAELKTLDPCCGSGHFLVAALLMLTPMRMELEDLSAREAVDRVLSENLHGLEIDQRCVELAAFALALAAWQFPESGGYRALPDLNVACCGLSVSVAKEEWKDLAKDNRQLRIALDWMFDEFRDAPVLGSLLNPAKGMAAKVVSWHELSTLTQTALGPGEAEEIREAVVVAHGLAQAASMLGAEYDLVMTNVPYLGAGKQHNRLQEHVEQFYAEGKPDLATALILRILDACKSCGTATLVTPHSWMFQSSYEDFRRKLLGRARLRFIVTLGEEAWSSFGNRGPRATLTCFDRDQTDEQTQFFGIKASTNRGEPPLLTDEDTAILKGPGPVVFVSQARQTSNPDARVVFESQDHSAYLSEYSACIEGISTGDLPRFAMFFWEIEANKGMWIPFIQNVGATERYGGRTDYIRWEGGHGALHSSHSAHNFPAQHMNGFHVLGNAGIRVTQMGMLPVTLYRGEVFGKNGGTLVLKDNELLPAAWAYCESAEYGSRVREIDQSRAVTVGSMIKIPFDLPHWQEVAAEKYPYGLPDPYSDDPTQWLFHGHPATAIDALQVVVARLLGYRWPAELDWEMELASDARVWVERSSQFTELADSDGIVCIPAVGSEQPAEDRLLNLLHRAYEDGRAQEQIFREKLEAADANDPVTVDLWRRGWEPSLPDSFAAWRNSLMKAAGHSGKSLESWLRDKFFAQHCRVFNHRPFIWHIWDGLKDGFSVLINYHKLNTKLLETLIYTYLNDWIKRQKQDQAAGVDGSEEKLAAALWLKERLELILEGESPYDIFVRWKPLEEQPVGWNPDLNDGVRLNIRPWMTVGDVKKKGAGLLRDKPNIKWTKDRGKDVASAPWYHLGSEYGGKEGDRINDHHLTLAEKKAVRELVEATQ